MSRSSGLADFRRRLRFAASAALVALICAGAMRLDQGSAALWLAGIAGISALWLVLRYPRPAGTAPDRPGLVHRAGRLMLLGGLALMLGALVVSRGGEQRAAIPALCESQGAVLAGWELRLTRIIPVAGDGHTAIEAGITASRAQGEPITLAPQLRSYFSAQSALDPASRVSIWRGDLALKVPAFDPLTGCITLAVSWRPLAGLARLGGWLAALGAGLMALIALGSLHWRRNARDRIAMRRSERPLPGPAKPAVGAWQLVPAAGLALALALAGWLALAAPGQSPGAAPAPFPRGAALVAARQSLLEGPPNTNRWIVIGDALARRGHFADAAGVLLGAVEADPNDSDGWLALGDALYGHAGGQLTPAAALAYDRADRAALARGALLPPAGLAMEASGRQELAQMWWRRQLARSWVTVETRAGIAARLNYSAP